jgi:hypothetical protein
MNMNIRGLKCDASDCDYSDDSILSKDYDKYLNMPCPKCGANLLTQADLNAVRAMEELVSNPAMQELDRLMKESGSQQVKATIHMNGTGFSGMKMDIQELNHD